MMQLLHFHLHVFEQVAAALREEGEGGGMKSEQEMYREGGEKQVEEGMGGGGG
jgi:hypothetical protein